MNIPSNIQDCVAFLGFGDPAEPDSIEVCGTCFFAVRPSDKTDGGAHNYLVTAKHVIANVAHMNLPSIFVRLNFKSGKAQWVGTHISQWIVHPTDSHADVAILAFSTRIFDQVQEMTWPLAAAATLEDLRKRDIGVGEDLFFPGLFWRHFGREKNLPIVRTGTIAGMPLEPIQYRDGYMDAYLVEARSIGGLSGSPVFVNLGGTRSRGYNTTTLPPQWALLGLIHGHYSDALAEDMTDGDRRVEMVNMGISIVVPVEKIGETLMHPELAEKFAAVEKHLERDTAT